MAKDKVGILTAGGLAPCLSSSIGRLIKKYSQFVPDVDIVGYLNGYKGLLLGKSITIPQNVRHSAELLYSFGGSVLGNSRVKLTNVEDCVKKGYVKKGENPLQIAADRLTKDGITILHTIGGDDTNTAAAELARYLSLNGYNLTVVGIPKTVDNDVEPIHQTLGAWTAVEQGAIFFENVANENTTSSRQLIIHEVMGRNCGWLTAATAYEYRKRLDKKAFLPDVLLAKEKWDIDAVYIPEMNLDMRAEVDRLSKLMDEKDCVNIFLSEGAGVETIVAEKESQGEEVQRDAFGHVRLDELNPGEWFAKRFSKMLNAEKTLVQKSGYFARSASPNDKDLELIMQSADKAVEAALNGQSGVVGLDEDENNEMRVINFSRIKGGKPFDIKQKWFEQMLTEIGQLR
ncbi:MAG: pyrophosphate--fructose-6-phosphate 1-phosphotransferase [Candidatus Cloacimonetes bacterium]|nr:pyrophosphate--fructose-6-phosphate 1-phosphotransferase [Candidatus Cloacimonadota bacterium]MCF7814209.1 pyrophosphate--fructose-6-phosphate 1-phosphotransferase [Candidatus Cloacimonadota bacterium]MCF7868132.1 pyrophosphate--fructose-6-phosphate 1-phosphotransferase [Candidatus Cloacimonadota bacterium]MCF7883598.1 pyrophosphate--fructose-6-phosphate 1-phosphotransferase [Candidatus Cloacimonadota bacterium]